MKLFLSLFVVVVTLGVLQSIPDDQLRIFSEEALKQLSQAGEKVVDEEMKRALVGVKQMREVMWRNEQKHEHLMKSLQRSSDKKKGAEHLAQEVTAKLTEAEEQCKDSLQSEWDECRPCLENACKDFYTSTCRRGFATFHNKVQNFFRRVSRRFGPEQTKLEPGDILVNQNSPETNVSHIEESFSQLMSQVGAVVNRSMALVSQMKGKWDQSLLNSFLNNTQEQSVLEREQVDPFYPARDSGYLQGVGLDEVLDSFYDFGRSVVQEFGAVVTQVFGDLNEAVEEAKKTERESIPRFIQNRKLCKDLRRQTSECWRLHSQCEACQGALLTECPSVRDLHVELDEVSQLLDASRVQYEEVLSIVRRHVDETLDWLSNMAAEFSWVSWVHPSTNRSAPQNIFRVTMVAPESHDENLPVRDTKVQVNILNSPPLELSVPGELEPQDPSFIQYIAQEALDKYKEMVRFEDV
ncbi:clusterin-like protein 1 [Periophthalmus magnuspinnatus]|uniref:clusterin-like protein 1 n=1 Tax=Periophthalmus magnuspinnatus TaxID=409849 RepID=UPI002436DE9F|nr:clusterin-like protein 1 [Periophthalmus magnuspinnatus]